MHKDDDLALAVHSELLQRSVEHQLEHLEHLVDSAPLQRIPVQPEPSVNQLNLTPLVHSALEHLDRETPILVDLAQILLPLVYSVKTLRRHQDLVQGPPVHLVQERQVHLVLGLVKHLAQEHLEQSLEDLD